MMRSSQFVTMAMGQLSERCSLRDIVAKKRHTLWVAQLPRFRFDAGKVGQGRRLRWQVALLFKERTSRPCHR